MGLNFILLTGIYFSQTEQIYWRQWLVIFLVSIWGVHLSLHIYLGNRGHGEDYRYQAMRKNDGDDFWWYSLFSVFILQGLLSFLIFSPIVWIFSEVASPFLFFDPIAIGLCCTGFCFEAVCDLQLKKFKFDPNKRGKILDQGLWALTRHPNCFGDAFMWWALFFLAFFVSNGGVTFFRPLVMSLFICYTSGVTIPEKSLSRTKPEYIA